MHRYQSHLSPRSQNRQSATPKRERKSISPVQASLSQNDAFTPDQPAESPALAMPTRRPAHSLASIPFFPPAESTPQESVSVDAEMIRQTAGQGRQTPADLTTGMVVQRLREGLTSETKPLTAKEDEAQKELFIQPSKAAKRKKGKKEIVELTEEEVSLQHLRQLDDKLIKLAEKVNKDYDKKAAQYTKSTGNDLEKTPYYKILELAIDKALGQYGAILEAALKENAGKGPGPLARVTQNPHDKSPIGLKRSQQIYDDLPEEEKEGEARTAIQYVIEHNGTIKNLMKDILFYHQKELPSSQELDPRSVEAAYVDALMNQKEKTELVRELAMQRVRHGPQTRGSTVYIEVTDKENKTIAWTHYKQLVHEALHTAAHSSFEAYLNSVPEELRNVINEGTVDYFAIKVWKQVASQLQANKSNPEYATVHGVIDPSETTPDQITQTDVDILQEYASRPQYPDEVKTIERAVAKLGEDRLKAAFFYGDVNHFFPSFETAMEEEKPNAVESNIDKEGKQEVKLEQPARGASERKKQKVTGEGND